MKLDSIRNRMLALIGISLLGMAVLVTTQVVFINRLLEVEADTALLAELNTEILQLRRHEKDFMLRNDLAYVDEFEQRANDFSRNLLRLEEVLPDYELADEQLNQLRASFSTYREQFAELVRLQLEIGVDENSGQQGDFRGSIHELEARLRERGLDKLLVQLLQLRRHEKDFILRRDLQYATLEREEYQRLRAELASLPDDGSALLSLLNDYHGSFRELVASYERMGLDPDAGIQGEFRNAAHASEEQLVALGATLRPLIAQRERDVMFSGVAIALLTAALMLGLLIRSVLALQRAFSTFIMFFYHCKREYQLLDVRKMQFAEFKSMAAVANEMVEARRDMETQLKDAQEKLAEYENKSE